MIVEGTENADALLARVTVEANDLVRVELTLRVLLHLDVEQSMLLSYPRPSMKLSACSTQHLHAVQALGDRSLLLFGGVLIRIVSRPRLVLLRSRSADLADRILGTRLASVDNIGQVSDEKVIGQSMNASCR